MHNQPTDQHSNPSLSEQGIKSSDDILREQLVAMTRRMFQFESAKSPSDIIIQDTVLREISSVSARLNRRREKKWTSTDDKLWERLLKACYDEEMASLKQQGHTAKLAKRLVKRGWARWDLDSSRFIETSERSGQKTVVPVVLVQREGGFSIHGEILPHLWDHPLLAEDLAGREGLGTKAFFMSMLNQVESIKQKHHLYDWEHIPLLADQEGPDRMAAQCVMAAADVEQELNSDLLGGYGDLVVDDGDTSERESLVWLTDAKGGTKLWQLLNTAIRFGQALNHYTSFHDTRIEEAIQLLLTGTPGKETSPQGKAVEKIIESFSREGDLGATPTNLLQWLGGERAENDGEALNVNHPLWESTLKEVSWDRFKNLVKGAKRRLET